MIVIRVGVKRCLMGAIGKACLFPRYWGRIRIRKKKFCEGDEAYSIGTR